MRDSYHAELLDRRLAESRAAGGDREQKIYQILETLAIPKHFSPRSRYYVESAIDYDPDQNGGRGKTLEEFLQEGFEALVFTRLEDGRDEGKEPEDFLLELRDFVAEQTRELTDEELQDARDRLISSTKKEAVKREYENYFNGILSRPLAPEPTREEKPVSDESWQYDNRSYVPDLEGQQVGDTTEFRSDEHDEIDYYVDPEEVRKQAEEEREVMEEMGEVVEAAPVPESEHLPRIALNSRLYRECEKEYSVRGAQLQDRFPSFLSFLEHTCRMMQEGQYDLPRGCATFEDILKPYWETQNILPDVSLGSPFALEQMVEYSQGRYEEPFLEFLANRKKQRDEQTLPLPEGATVETQYKPMSEVEVHQWLIDRYDDFYYQHIDEGMPEEEAANQAEKDYRKAGYHDIFVEFFPRPQGSVPSGEEEPQEQEGTVSPNQQYTDPNRLRQDLAEAENVEQEIVRPKGRQANRHGGTYAWNEPGEAAGIPAREFPEPQKAELPSFASGGPQTAAELFGNSGQEQRARRSERLPLVSKRIEFGTGTITGYFTVEEKGEERERPPVTIKIPREALADLEGQKENLKACLAELMELNNYKANPRVHYDKGQGKLIFYYGDNPMQNRMCEVSVDRIVQHQKFKDMGPDAIQTYLLKKEHQLDYENADFSTMTKSERERWIELQRKYRDVVNPFERELVNMIEEIDGREHKVSQYSKDKMFRQLWEARVGSEKVSELQTKLSEHPQLAGVAAEGGREVRVAGQRGQVRWREAVRTVEQDPTSTEKAAEFLRAVKEGPFQGDWESLFKTRDALYNEARQSSLNLREAILIAGKDILPSRDYEYFKRLYDMPDEAVYKELYGTNPPDGKTVKKSGLLLTYLLRHLRGGRQPAVREGRRREVRPGARERLERFRESVDRRRQGVVPAERAPKVEYAPEEKQALVDKWKREAAILAAARNTFADFSSDDMDDVIAAGRNAYHDIERRQNQQT